jgi:hypothetical protein
MTALTPEEVVARGYRLVRYKPGGFPCREKCVLFSGTPVIHPLCAALDNCGLHARRLGIPSFYFVKDEPISYPED